MSRSFWLTTWPPPAVLAPPTLGLDISDRSVKFVKLGRTPDGLAVVDFGEREVPVGAIVGGRVVNTIAVTAVLADIRQATGASHIAASLPEEETFIARLTLPTLRAKEIRGALELQLEEHIPLSPGDAVFDYERYLLPTALNPELGLVIAALPRRTVMAYLAIIKAAGFVASSLEIEATALARAFFTRAATATVLVVDLGKVRTGLSIIRGQLVFLSSTINAISGDDFTLAIKKTLNVSTVEAEKLKVTEGLASASRREQFFALVPILSALKDEITKTYLYWNERVGAEPGIQPVSQIILTGGQATLPGLANYLASTLRLPVEIGNVWTNIYGQYRTVPPINFTNASRYATALGLALRPFSYD